MTLPGFSAEATLYRTTGRYRASCAGADTQPVAMISPSGSGKQCCTPADDPCILACLIPCESAFWWLGGDCDNWCASACCQCPGNGGGVIPPQPCCPTGLHCCGECVNLKGGGQTCMRGECAKICP